VICVGNITVGGTGKTPIVRELLLTLTQRGLDAHGLARGYGGKDRGRPASTAPATPPSMSATSR
jgi:tetraacyldisaccharide 4'-kinase